MTEIIVPEMYGAVKEAIAAYKNELESLLQQEEQLNAELEEMQSKMVENNLSREVAGVSEKVYLLAENQEISSRSRLIESILEELQEEKHLLKVKYMDIYRTAAGEAEEVKRQFNINSILDRHLLALFTEITSIANQMKAQHMEIFDDMAEVFADERINTEYRNARYKFTRDGYKLSYFESRSDLLKKDHISYALSGYMHPTFENLKTKEAVSNG